MSIKSFIKSITDKFHRASEPQAEAPKTEAPAAPAAEAPAAPAATAVEAPKPAAPDAAPKP